MMSEYPGLVGGEPGDFGSSWDASGAVVDGELREGRSGVARLPDPDDVAVEVFGASLDRATSFVRRLADDGVVRGLIGPREVPRLWDRHLVNCALVTDLVPDGARVVDIGSGAGLPGIAMALRRADLAVDLVEPMLRRTSFLEEVVAELDLGGRVRVVRGRAEDRAVIEHVGECEWVTARALAPLDRLAAWSLPLLAPGGQLLAMKGSRAAEEVAQHSKAMRRFGAAAIDVVTVGSGAASARVVKVVRGARGSGR